jgi:hypothetical protein
VVTAHKVFGIPRLQELRYLEVTANAVRDGKTFEGVRRDLLDHMMRLRDDLPTSGNIASLRIRAGDPLQYARNATETLKELMRLDVVVRKGLPSTAKAAPAYRNTTFQLTEFGETWTQLLAHDPRRAYDELLDRLLAIHPQFAAFLRVLASQTLTIPLLQWTDVGEPRTHDRYVRALAAHVAEVARKEELGWSASASEIELAVGEYALRIARASADRPKKRPFARNQDFINTCEEALVKFAWARAGVQLDYISQQILRRWTKFLSVANFSYHVPAPSALRYWSTSDIKITPQGGLSFERRVGTRYREAVTHALANGFDAARREDPGTLWVPIHVVRAAVCWELKLRDEEFDAALQGLLEGKHGAQDLTFGVNVDPAMYGNVPPSESPLRLATNRGERVYYSMSLVPKGPRS